VTIVPLGTLPEPAPELVAEDLLVDATETLGLAEPIPQPVVFDYVEEPVVENVPALPVVMPEVLVPAEVVAVEEEESSPELAARRRRRRSSATVD
jgi:hypothetical protein